MISAEISLSSSGFGVIYLSSIFHLFLGHCQGFVVLSLLKGKKPEYIYYIVEE
jgi:hypothetical protein